MGSAVSLTRTTERKPTVEDDWQLANAMAQVAEMRVPRIHGNNRHEYLFVGVFDGTNQTKDLMENARKGEVRTAVGYLADEIEAAGRKHGIAVGYQTGVGVDGNMFDRLGGLARGGGAIDKIERQYQAFCEQAAEWRKQDPQAQLRVVGMGFSRGGDQAAAFMRMVHDRGVLKPGSKTEYLVPPGKTPMAAILLDPVASGELEKTDRRLPASTLFGLQVVSRDERRLGFASNRILTDGASSDGRFLSVTVPGGHGDTAHGHRKDAASVRVENAVVDVFNAFAGKHIIDKVPQSKGDYLKLHDSDWKVPKSLENLLGNKDPGARAVQTSLAPPSKCEKDEMACYRIDPVDKAMQKQFQYKKQEHAPERETDGPGHVRVEPSHSLPISPELKPALHTAIAAMEALKTRHPELAQVSAPQLAAGAMNQWKSAGAAGMFTEAHLTRAKDGTPNVVLTDISQTGPTARRESVSIEALTRIGFEEGLAQLVQNQSDERNAQLKQAQTVQPKPALLM